MASSNMYSASADEIWGLFADYVEGSPDAGALALSTGPLSPTACNALEKSLAAFGYGNDALAYATLLPHGVDANGAGEALDPQAEFLLIEGLDPICLIACDERAIASLETTYRTTCKRDAAQHVFGRPCVAFGDLPILLTTDQGKQRAWSLLKTLPRIT